MACAACNLASPSPTATDLPAPTVETYTNANHSYSFQYPAGLPLEEDPDGRYVWIDRQIFVTAEEFNPEDAFGDGPLIESAEDTVVGSMPARRLSGYIGTIGGNTPQRYVGVVVPHNNLFYVVMAYELKYDEVLPIEREMQDVPPEILAVFEQVVASLRLT